MHASPMQFFSLLNEMMAHSCPASFKKKNIPTNCIPSYFVSLFPFVMLFSEQIECVLICIIVYGKLMYLFLPVSLNSVIAFLDADFHSLPTMQQRQQHCPVSVAFGELH